MIKHYDNDVMTIMVMISKPPIQFLHSLSESNLVVQPLKVSLSQLKESSGDDLFVLSVGVELTSNLSE